MKMIRAIGVLLAAALCATLALYGQAVTGSLLGTVTDSSGATVPNARVVITEMNTGISRTAETNQSGNYSFPTLEPGLYRVSVEHTGFRKAVKEGIAVLVNSTVRADLELQPGAVTETVNVVAEAAILQTDRSDTGRKIETQQIVNMPLSFNRNFQSLLNLVPGTTRAFRPHSEFFNSQDSLSTQVNGLNRLANNVQLEGIDNNHRTGLLTVLIPPIEALETVDITTSNYEAELGRAGGAVTNVMLRSGTNDLHGSAYEFHRDSALNGKNTFAQRKPVTTYNYYGFTLGGPIRKNKTFAFGDYLGIKDRRGDTFRVQVPTLAFRGGDLSESKTAIYDPAAGNRDGTARRPFPGNMVPSERISPFARKILALVPPPNLGNFSGTNYETSTVRRKDTDSFDIKVDHQQTESDRISVRYSYQKPVVIDPPLFGQAGGGGKGFAGTGTNRTQNLAVNYTRIFSPTLILETRAGVSRYRNDAYNADYGTKAAEALGIRGANLDDFSSGLTSIDISGYSNPVVGYSASLPWKRSETNFNFIANLTKIRTNHTFKFGADVRRLRDELLQTQTFGGSRGIFNYRAGTTALNGGPSTSFANAFASFLLDIPNSFGRDLPVIFPAYRQTPIFLYAQDKWQVSSKLTLDLGLRWEFYPPATPRFSGGFSNYNWENNTLVIAGIGNNPSNLGRKTYYRDFAPRFGIAYRITSKTVIRGGFGISWVPFPDNTYAFNFPVKQNNAFQALDSYSQALLPNGQPGSMAAGFPAPIPAVIPQDGIIRNPSPGEDYFVIPLDYHEGYVEAWNLALQRQLPGSFVFEAAYVGNHTVRAPVAYNLNASQTLNSGAAGRPLFQRFRRNADTELRYQGFSNNYNALQMKFDRRFAGGFLLTTAYTYGKALGYTSEDGGLQYYINPRRNYARLNFDRTHTFVQSYIYELPFGRGKRWARSGPASWIVGNWQLNGILTLMTGTPLNFGTSSVLNTPGNGNSPNVAGPIRVLHGIGRETFWFDTTNFSAPPSGTFGSLGRYVVDGPSFRNFDFSVFRIFPIKERAKVELRFESFNFTNTPPYNNPDTGQGNANFGKVTGAGDPRSIQFGAKVSF